MRVGCLAFAWALVAAGLAAMPAFGQSFGVELRNTLMPASGGMAGTSIAQPQDLVSAINGNPAALTQYRGTQFIFGGAWAEPTFNLEQTGNLVLPGVTPFAAKSQTPGTAAPNIGVAHELDAWGLPATLGLGLISAAGGGTDFRKQPQSNGTTSALTILEVAFSGGVKLTDRLSLGAALFTGDGFFNGPFVGISSMTIAYALRGTVGVNYELAEHTSAGFYYQTSQRFRFRDAVRLQLANGSIDIARDVHLELPDNIGIGIANSSLMDGRLLLAMDVLFLDWRNVDFFRNIYRNQWVMQVGSQFTLNPRWKLRFGYALAENPINPNTGDSIGDIILPGGIPAVKYLQAQLAVINQHRLTGGVGVSDVLPGVDFDAFAGGMFQASQFFGNFTEASMNSYWIGACFTWRFDHGLSTVN